VTAGVPITPRAVAKQLLALLPAGIHNPTLQGSRGPVYVAPPQNTAIDTSVTVGTLGLSIVKLEGSNIKPLSCTADPASETPPQYMRALPATTSCGSKTFADGSSVEVHFVHSTVLGHDVRECEVQFERPDGTVVGVLSHDLVSMEEIPVPTPDVQLTDQAFAIAASGAWGMTMSKAFVDSAESLKGSFYTQ
jgi:hypothetical protein